MPAIALKAHYDGKHILLDEPYALPPRAQLMVTVLSAPAAEQEEDEDQWLRAASTSGALNFLAGPAEDIYTLEDGEPFCDAL